MENTNETNEDLECCICFEPMTLQNTHILECNHAFHSKCISMCNKFTCPLCRKGFTLDTEVYLLELQCTQSITKHMLLQHFPELLDECFEFVNKNKQTIVLYFYVAYHRDNWYKCFIKQPEIHKCTTREMRILFTKYIQ